MVIIYLMVRNNLNVKEAKSHSLLDMSLVIVVVENHMLWRGYDMFVCV
jgi:hypothetical protein